MKLLFDENLSYRLVGALSDLFPGSAHVRDVGLQGQTDQELWSWAREHGFILVSKDADFYARSLIHGAPPKVVWMRIGNASVSDSATLLRDRYILIRRFSDDPSASILPLHAASSGKNSGA